MNLKILSLLIAILMFSGCASVMDAPRNILGFSRRDLNASRENSSFQVYQVGSQELFDVTVEVFSQARYTVFTKDAIRGFIAVMDIPGVVNTTEVGVFLTAQPDGRGVKIELSSRSTPAKRTVAALLFSKLGEKFTRI